jgi:4-hydroxymandelate oxidase
VEKLLNLEDFEAAAREVLPRYVYDYIASGAEDERTTRRNRAAFEDYLLRPRGLAGTGHPRLETTVLGTPISLPVLLAPTAMQRLAHEEGELATARAAAAAGTILPVSTLSTHSIEEISRATTGPLWFQLYIYRDRGLTEALVRRAEAAGYVALCLTIDTPVLGTRERDVRNGFTLPEGIALANFSDRQYAELPADQSGSALTTYFASQLDPDIAWSDLDWLCSITKLPVAVKGIMTAEDAALAIEHGASAVIVSNHGGRQLDSAPATMEVIEEVVGAVDGRCEVLLDGGIRRGTDVVKALALGARAVLIGRPYVWGLAVAGEGGVRRILELLRAETTLALTLCGCRDAASVSRTVVMKTLR